MTERDTIIYPDVPQGRSSSWANKHNWFVSDYCLSTPCGVKRASIIDYNSGSLLWTFDTIGTELTFSADDTHFAMTGPAISSGGRDIYISDTNGSNLTNITNTLYPQDEFDPDWRPTSLQLKQCIGYVVGSSGARVRAQPYVSDNPSNVVTTLEHGVTLAVVGKTTGADQWYRVRWLRITTIPPVFMGEQWVVKDVNGPILSVNETNYECNSLPPYNSQGTPEATYTPSITPIPSITPTPYPSPTFGPSPTPMPRYVSTEAAQFHSYAQLLGLPMPFDLLAYNVVQPGQRTQIINGQEVNTDDPLGWFAIRPPYAVQGFGSSMFAYNHRSLYAKTFAIHSGVDYGNEGVWIQRVVVSLCDGVVIDGNMPTGGSAQPGRGVSVRCFMDSLGSGRSDTDYDGLPNLSNIVVTYNHFLTGVTTIQCNLVSNYTTCTGSYTYPQIGEVVYSGTPLGQTGGDPDFDHLHLSVFFARGFARETLKENAFYLNPIILYTDTVVNQHVFQRYFPVQLPAAEDKLGINAGELTSWSAGGLNSIPYGDMKATPENMATPTNKSFWDVQNSLTPPPNDVQWPIDNYPLIPSNNPVVITDLIEFLVVRYTNSPYQPVNCILTPVDVVSIPQRITTICDLSDLFDETPYVPAIPHPATTE